MAHREQGDSTKSTRVLKLVIATPLYPPEPGGPATYAKLLEEGLPSYGIEPTLVKFAEVRRYPKLVRHILYFKNVRRAARTADCILVLDPVSTGLPAALAALSLRKPFVVKIVGDYAWEQGRQRFGVTAPLDEFVGTRSVPLPVAFLRAVEMWVAQRAALVIVPSEYLKRIVSAWGVAQASITVIYNTFQAEAPAAVPSAVAALSRPHIATMGRLVPWKGIDGVIDAVSRLRAAYPTLSLVVVGDGPERERLEERAKALTGSVVFTGALSHPEALAVLADTDLYALNSTYEGLSHQLIEALSLGTPTIATAVGGNTELITDGENGLLVPPGDESALVAACERLLRDQSMREKLSMCARESMKRFSRDAMLAQTKEALMRL